MKLAVAVLALTSLLGAEVAPDKAIGPATAPILLDLYSDFECPHCKVLHDQTIAPVIENYAEKGKVQLAYRDFPMPMHSHAREAARWANAAARIHKYRQVGDALFRTQAEWSKSGDIRRAVASVLSATEMKTVAALVHDPGVEAAIDRDVKMGAEAGVNGTPSMILTRKLQTYPIQQFISYPIMAHFLDGLAKR